MSKKIFFLSLLCLVFLAGLIAGTARLAPARWLEESFMTWQNLSDNYLDYAGVIPQRFLHKSKGRLAKQPVIIHKKERAQAGATLIASWWDGNNGLRLLDMDGKVLHSWTASINAIFADTSEWPPLSDGRSVGDWDVDIHGMQLYPDGSVVFNFEYYGLVKLDSCSRVLWNLPMETHHSVEFDDGGYLWVPAHKTHTERHSRFPIIKAGMEEDFILKISPEGEVLQTIPLLQALLESDLAAIIFVALAADASGDHTDITHLNSVDILPKNFASAFPLFNTGDILVSMRNLNMVAVLDAKTYQVKWWHISSFIQQHDADFLPNGRIGVFDNRGKAENPLDDAHRASRIVEINPEKNSVNTLYKSDNRNIFSTYIRGNQQFLANGNILIAEWVNGRAFEVDKNGDIVWQWIHRYSDDYVVEISNALRYDFSYLDFLKENDDCDLKL